MSSGTFHKIMRKTSQSRARNADFYVINITLAVEHPTELHTREELMQNNVRISARNSTMTSMSYYHQWIRRM
jgi:N-acetylglucosamine-6-phosphate deacetylase